MSCGIFLGFGQEGEEEAAGKEVGDEGEPEGVVAQSGGEEPPEEEEQGGGCGHGCEHLARAGQADGYAVESKGHEAGQGDCRAPEAKFSGGVEHNAVVGEQPQESGSAKGVDCGEEQGHG